MGPFCRRPGNQGTQTCRSTGRDALLQAAWYGHVDRPAVQDPREGAKPREENNVKTPSRAALARCSGGAENPRPSLPLEEAVMSAVTHRPVGASVGQRRSCRFSVRGTARPQVPEERDKGFPIGATRPKTARTTRRMSSSSPPPRHRLILLQAKTAFLRVGTSLCSRSKMAVVGSLPA